MHTYITIKEKEDYKFVKEWKGVYKRVWKEKREEKKREIKVLKNEISQTVVEHAFYPSTQEAEAGGSLWVWG